MIRQRGSSRKGFCFASGEQRYTVALNYCLEPTPMADLVVFFKQQMTKIEQEQSLIIPNN